MVLRGIRLPPTEALMGDPFLGGFFRAIGRGARTIGRGLGRGLGSLGRVALGGGPTGPGAITLALPPELRQAFTGPPIPTAPMGHGSSGIRIPPRPGRTRTGFGVFPPATVTGGTIHAVGAGAGMRRRRRINPLNPRALRRSLRRIEGFRRFAMRAGFVPRGTRVRKVFPFRRTRRRRAA